MAEQWGLTETERRQAWLWCEAQSGFNPSPESYDEVEDLHIKAAAQAQLRKVVEKLAGRHLFKAWEWEELKKEAGLSTTPGMNSGASFDLRW